MSFTVSGLSKFLVKAKNQTYAGEGKELIPERKKFKELEFAEGEWYYRDSYAGFFSAPGQEIVYFQKKPVWTLAYSGGMIEKYQSNLEFAKQTFSFLKKALLLVSESRPFRGPSILKEGDWEYRDSSEGSVSRFKGYEQIFYKGELVFSQDYIGGFVLDK